LPSAVSDSTRAAGPLRRGLIAAFHRGILRAPRGSDAALPAEPPEGLTKVRGVARDVKKRRIQDVVHGSRSQRSGSKLRWRTLMRPASRVVREASRLSRNPVGAAR